MTVNSRITSLLQRLTSNAERFTDNTNKLIERQNASGQQTEQGLNDLRAAQQNRVASPDAAFQTLSQFITTSPGAAFGAGILANDVDFANFVNKRIDDARENLGFQFQERGEDRADVNLISEILGDQVSQDNVPISAEINALESSLDRQNRLQQIRLQGQNQAAAAATRANAPSTPSQSEINNLRNNAALALQDQLDEVSIKLESDDDISIADLGSFTTNFGVILSNAQGVGISDLVQGDISVIDKFDKVLGSITKSFNATSQQRQALNDVITDDSGQLRDGVPVTLQNQHRELSLRTEVLSSTLSQLQSSIENSKIEDSTKQVLLSRIPRALQ